MKYLSLLLLMASASFASTQEELDLRKNCANSELNACANLSAFYIKSSQWDKAFVIGEALCKKEVMKGCTFAGMALLAKGQLKEGITLLTKSCDGFEAYACRSLARLMKENQEELLSYMYSKRACFYGLSEICKTLKKPKATYSQKGIDFLKSVASDCEDTKSSSCQDRLRVLQDCKQTLSENDCVLIPGELSIFFRAKLVQESAKLALMNVVAAQNLLKENSKRYSYDLDLVLKEKKPQASHYVFGFMRACTIKYERSKKISSTSYALDKKTYGHFSSRTKRNIAAFFLSGKKSDCYDPVYGFEAFAVGNLDPLNTARLDIWKINRDGNIIHLKDGLPEP